MADAQDIEKRLKAIIDYVQDCERRVLKGEIMDLQGLDKNVVEICDAVAAMPRKESQGLEKRMSQLIDLLETLAGAMKAQQDKLATAGGR
jgi:hypothetical protein